MPLFKTVRGMRDFLPDEAKAMKNLENRARRIAKLYGYDEIITPIVESYELLSAKAGDEVRSRMFFFKDLGGRDVALRYEFTASVARLVATAFRNEPKPLRLFSVGTLYRYDEPQKGRYREFWQSNYELMGSSRPEADAEIIMLTDSLLKSAGLKGHTFKIGHVGVLRSIFHQEKLQEDTQNAIMQLMDKKQCDAALETVKNAGASANAIKTIQKLMKLKSNDAFDVVDKMRSCVENYKEAADEVDNLFKILKLISESRCEIGIHVDASFARGLEYYTGMIFEVNVPELDIALGGGGRYDKLVELFGGEPTPALGVAHGLDRILLALQMQNASPKEQEASAVVVIAVQESLIAEAMKIAQKLRDAEIRVEVDVMGRKVAKALENADRKKIDYAVIVGEKELAENSAVVKDLQRREQKAIKIDEIANLIKSGNLS
ncbi:MAG: histidine--tRNA ligase [Candidatus Bathyarchaeota archaeon]|nr:histidine--tRNA ligase [Candidatus Bathyarchaeota archaeon]